MSLLARTTICLTYPKLPLIVARTGMSKTWCEDRIRITKDTGPRNLPLHGLAQKQIWCQLVALAGEITTWMGLLWSPDAEHDGGR
ncbi:hypothetical protein C7K25_00645 [Gulosibacter molinativorax]|uniref:Uncharacterized protein n=1 Tax=Gulosibacter molinativorax TaxID=256821 RepID=A0ABT7C3S0_9MICO|nr:hypothetical protein [Gulosibacter molinativorax]QUY61861.1 Hypotetical protein [Gulosibacter molinativorax]